jgi:choline dehydrogenase-like flavoprotein
MLYIRGQAEDYEAWESAGNIGWGYRDLMKYFISPSSTMVVEPS